MTRIKAKLFAVTVIFTAFLHVAPLFSAPVTWVSSSGSDGNPYPCTAAKPCATIGGAANSLDNAGQINCLNSPGFIGAVAFTGFSATVDCAGVWETSVVALSLNGNQVWKLRNLTISGAPGGSSAIKVVGGGTLIIENCVFENFSGIALDIEPTAILNLVVANSRISTSGAGVLIKPAAGGFGSVTATFNGVTIVDNTGGGLKTDTTNGPVTVDISNSTISKNVGNGMNAVSGAGGANVLNLKNDVIAGNGTAGVQANGTNAAALIDMTLLDSNASGALTTINGGRLLTYGNNHIIGSAGSGFTGTAPSQ